VADLKAQLPELPDDKKERFVREHGLSGYDAGVLVAGGETGEYFEAVVGDAGGRSRDPKLAANWVINELAGRLNREGTSIAAAPVSGGQLGGTPALSRPPRRYPRSHRRQHDPRQDCQRCFRDRLDPGR